MSDAAHMPDACSASRARFAELCEFAEGTAAAALGHAGLEEELTSRGRELPRQLYQDHLDLRAQREVRLAAVTDAGGVAHHRVEADHERTLATVFGEVTVRRIAYRALGRANLYPADAALGLPAERHSHGLRRLAAVFDEAHRRDPTHARTWVALVDGANHQIDRINAEADRRGVKVHVLCDIVHVFEYLWKATWCFHREGDPAAEAWVHDKARDILAGKARTVAATIRRTVTTRALSTPARKGADDAARYLTNKAPYLDYRPRSPEAGRSPPASSKAPADIWSRTAST